MRLDVIAGELSELAASRELLDDEALEARVKAIDDLEFAEDVITAYLRAHRSDPMARQLLAQASELRSRLTNVDHRLFERYRDLIRSHTISHLALRRVFDRYTGYTRAQHAYRHLGFESLDRLVAGILLRDRAPEPMEPETPEMVAYQPTPASVVLELVDALSLRPADAFCDVGSGLGQVVHLMSLLTGVRAMGIEVDPGLCAYASAIARDLDMENATFANADARDADYTEGTVFYLFTPFTGSILVDVLARLRQQARERPIRVCGYGPITPHLAEEPWLSSLNDHRRDEFRLALFESKR